MRTFEKKCARRKKVSEWAHHFPPIVVNVDIFGNTDIAIFACPPKIGRRYVELSMNVAGSFQMHIAENENDENTYGKALPRLSYKGTPR